MKPAPLRCPWCGDDPLYTRYHDEEWGVPVHDDRRLFEKIVLEGAQAGLSWITVLRKRAHYRELFEGFEPERVARFDARWVDRVLSDPGIIRNRSKVESAIDNARRVLQVQERFGSLDALLWRSVGGRPLQNRRRRMADLPSSTPEAEAMSRELKRLGFRFVGPTICYALMQSVGMVNDHLVSCFRHAEIANEEPA